jgi:small ligand-binding sensory domain FIST
MPFASALSEHPLTAHAVGEAAGWVLEKLGAAPDLATLFVTPPHAGALEDAAATVASVLGPRVLIGCAATSVVGNGREVEQGPAVSLWAGRMPELAPVQLAVESVAGSSIVTGWPYDVPFEPQALLLIADPYSFDAEAVFADLEERWPGLPVLGGLASAAVGPGGNRLLLNGRVTTAGAVGVLLGRGVRVESVVSQGCRPIGQPLAVTDGENQIVRELAGRPPLERLVELAQNDLDEQEVAVINSGGLHVGVVIDENKAEFERGDFLIRNVLGGDSKTGAIAIGQPVELGTTLQFQLRDAASADEDLRQVVAGHGADGVLLFTCNGRGTHMFVEPDHDAGVVAEVLGDPPTAGFFAAGEFGPVGGRNFVHGFTASMALFTDPAGRVGP